VNGFIFAQQQRSTVNSDNDKSYSAFRENFIREIEKYREIRKQDSTLFDFKTPAIVPSWFTGPNESDENDFLIPGATDPGTNPAKSVMIAKLRALCIIALLDSPQVSNSRENYTEDRQSTHQQIFAEFTRVTGKLYFDTTQFRILETHTTQYDETILLAGFKKSIDKNSSANAAVFEFQADLFTKTIRSGNRFDVNEHLDIQMTLKDAHKNEAVHASFFSKRMNRIVNTGSTLNQVMVADLPALALRYTLSDFLTNENGNRQLDTQTGQCLQNGLWYAMVSGILMHLSDEVHHGSMHFKQMGDVYNDLASYISREFTSEPVSIPKPALQIQNNHLYLLFPETIRTR
jgi:hypothetical protein